MKSLLFTLLLAVSASSLFAQGAPPQGSADQPYIMEYYYKAQWGHQQEFLQLFLKNHYPLLLKNVAAGRMLSVKIETPANHGTEDGRWDYRSEEHTSELQSLRHLVCRLLLEKKKHVHVSARRATADGPRCLVRTGERHQ